MDAQFEEGDLEAPKHFLMLDACVLQERRCKS